MLEKDCNGNPISTFPPCYAFPMIFTELAPRLIESISCNVRNRKIALKRLCCDWLSYCVCGVFQYAGGTLQKAGGTRLDNGKAKEQWPVEFDPSLTLLCCMMWAET